MLMREYSEAGRMHRVTVTKHREGGWDVREERDAQLLRETRYTDWHRVERAVSKMTSEASELERSGWRENADR